MKKCMFVLIMLSFLSSSCLALYTVTGRVYYAYTTTTVPGATVNLVGIGCTATTTSDPYGTFTLQCSGDMSGTNMTLTAQSATGLASGQKTWQVPANTSSQNMNVYIWPTIQPFPELQIPTMAAHWTGSPGPAEFASPFQLQSTGAPVQVQNAQINMVFNGAILGVNNVMPALPDVTVTDWIVPAPGQLQVNVEVNPPRDVPDFPAESFFDVFFEVDIPEEGALLGQVTIEDAIFNMGGGAELFAIPHITNNLVGEYEYPSPYFLVDSQEEWQIKLDAEWPDMSIQGLTLTEGQEYLAQLDLFELPDSEWPYSPIEPDLPDFIPPELYVYEGDDDPGAEAPDDAGLVMKWGDEQASPGERASAWKYKYDDPDLTNCIITVTATPPSGCNINRISIGMQDVNGNVCSWWWVVPSAVFPYDTPTTVQIDTSQINMTTSPSTGLAAATPPASGCAINPAFDLKQVQNIIADENANPMGGVTAPPPGGQVPAVWNYWHNLSVKPKPPATGVDSKWYVKYSQPPVEVEDGLIDGWDQYSQYYSDPQQGTIFSMAADDWKCYDDRPVTDIHWWGSYIGWTQPNPPQQVPDYFKICIWQDVPQNVIGPDGLQTPYSRPLTLLWEHDCYKWVWNFAGYDLDPRWQFLDHPDYDAAKLGSPQENEACFQFTQLLDQDDWFHQEPMEVLPDGTVVPNVYWISISAVYLNTLPANVQYPWGWKTRPHDPTLAPDTAGVINDVDVFPFVKNATMVNGFFPLVLPDPDQYPSEKQYDLTFELTTNEPKCPGLRADLNDDCIVSLPDFAIMAQEWLKTSP